jgi:transglutaminase-like putative cysteine protease
MDTARLLIALLRASEIPAQYVRGRVVMDDLRAQNWVGNAPDVMAAGTQRLG